MLAILTKVNRYSEKVSAKMGNLKFTTDLGDDEEESQEIAARSVLNLRKKGFGDVARLLSGDIDGGKVFMVVGTSGGEYCFHEPVEKVVEVPIEVLAKRDPDQTLLACARRTLELVYYLPAEAKIPLETRRQIASLWEKLLEFRPAGSKFWDGAIFVELKSEDLGHQELPPAPTP